MSDTSLSLNENRAPADAPPFAVVADSHDRRVALFQQALAERKLPAATVIDYRRVAAGEVAWEREIPRGCIVRIDSPGRDFETYRSLLTVGADAAEAEGAPVLSRATLARLEPQKGKILLPRQWYLGFTAVLDRVGSALAERSDVVLTNHPHDVAVMFDKSLCHAVLSRAGLPVPPPIGAVENFQQLRDRMRQLARPRVFVKLRHGSGASGVAALQPTVRGLEAWTTCEMVAGSEGVELYNNRRIRRYRNESEVARLVDTLCRHGAHCEAWVPKAGIDGCACDLRIVVIAGQPRHAVMRLSKTPLTNLHLRNARRDTSAIRSRMSEPAWRSLMDTCRRTAAMFPRTLHVGIDVAVLCHFRRHMVLEVNAFGDLLDSVTWNGQDTYAVELAAMLAMTGCLHD
ncbi:MAG: STM4014 family protein [Planctomycetaceae bacterium]|nr:STM4014 family protein [Planctomycetaceae bacterium]